MIGSMPGGDPDAGSGKLGRNHRAQCPTVDLVGHGLLSLAVPEQQHLFLATTLNPEVDQSTVAIAAEASRPVAQRQHGRICLQADPLLEAGVLEEVNRLASFELKASNRR